MNDDIRTGTRSTATECNSTSHPVAMPNLIGADCELITPEMLTLVELDQHQIDTIVQSVPGGAKNVQDIYPLSPLQEGLLFHHLLNEQSDTYVISTLFSAQSRADVDALIKALQKVIDRHQILRSAVIWGKSPQPVQVVYRSATMPVEELVLDPDRNPIEQFNDWMRPERLGLNLQRAPLVRVQVAADPHATQWHVLLQIHHIACDHQSLNGLVEEAMACVHGREQELPAPAAYRDYVAWAISHARTQDAESFFRSKLGEVDEPTAPFGVFDVHGDGSQVEEASQVLEPALTERVRIQARRFGMSPARLFHAAWALVVAHASGRDDVVYGTVLLAAQRRNARAQPMLGLFVNTLPLRLQLHRATAKELVEQTHQELAELLKHEQASLTLAQRCSGNGGTAPLFTSVLNYRRSVGHSVIDPKAGHTNGTGIRVLTLQYRTNYPIELSVDDLGDVFSLTAHTERRIDPHRTAGHLKTAMQSLMDALEQAPQTPALSLSILPESERRQIVESFNATGVVYPQEKLTQELFEAQARLTPDAVALVHEQQSLTYAELNGRANRLARYLRDRQVGPDQLVGICVERSTEMVVGLLGILKAGAAYVPLDPNYPIERLQYMLEDSAPRVVLTQERLMSLLLPTTQPEVVALDTKWNEIAGHAEDNLLTTEVGQRAHDLVYVIYTSGSTGRPKGTAMAHRSMVNLIEWHRKSFPGNEGKRALQFAALSFDVAFQEIFSTLCTGGTLVLLDEWVRRDPRALTELLREHAIQRLFVPPLILQSLAENFKSTGLAPESLQDVITAGEQLRISPEIRSFFQRFNGCRLHNHYGPTESHVVTALTLTGDPGEWPDLPAIGRPISNTQMYVLDGRRQFAPIGVAGEIFIGGIAVARGYLRQPGLTTQRFVADPFSDDPQALLYKTGDLGRWRADGTLEYLGRNDDQVKIRGYRIELGEIEAQLTRHTQVREASVVVREDHAGAKRLVAYVTLRDQCGLDVEELRKHLQTALPEHMVPSAFVVLESLPLTPSGKLDRRALPVPELEAYASQEYEAPQGEIEEALAGIWQELLHLEQIGRHGNFFELGGDSLTTMKLIVRVAERFAIQFHIHAVFRYPILRDMAQFVEKLRCGSQRTLRSRQTELEEGVI